MALTCSNDTTELLKVSKFDHLSEEICFPKPIRDISVYVGVWCVVISVFGALGNMITILAIPYATKRKK